MFAGAWENRVRARVPDEEGARLWRGGFDKVILRTCSRRSAASSACILQGKGKVDQKQHQIKI